MAIFHEFSPVTCNVLTNMYGKSRGFCLMQFETEEKAKEAVLKMNKIVIGGRAIEVLIRIMTALFYIILYYTALLSLVSSRQRTREDR